MANDATGARIAAKAAGADGMTLPEDLQTLIEQGRIGEIEAELQQLRQQQPLDPELVLRHAQSRHSQGRLEEAVPDYLLAISLAPDSPEPLRSLALALQEAGEIDQALTVYRQAVEVGPEDPQTLYHFGRFITLYGNIEKSRPFYKELCRVDPDNPLGPYSLAILHRKLGEFPEALACLEQAGALAIGNIAPGLWVLSERIFLLSLCSELEQGAYDEATATYWKLLRSQRDAASKDPPEPAAGEKPPAEPARPARVLERLRLGILSSDLGEHVVGTFLNAFLEGYDGDQLHVELIATKLRHEASAEDQAAQSDRVHCVQGLSLEQARALLRERRFDVLIDTAGFTDPRGLQVLAERCAPVQCHWIGFHASTGLDTIDWFVGDEHFTPEAFAPQFSERLWRLPRPWLARRSSMAFPEAISTLSDGAPVLGSFNQLAKVREATLDHWAAALHALPAARLMIKDVRTDSEVACERIRGGLSERGIAPERVSFLAALVSHSDHLRLYNDLDIALDTTPWSSSSTAFDALAMGVPLVAIRGRCASARMSTSVLMGIGREEWIADDPTSFAATVSALAADLPALRQGKADRQKLMLASRLHDPADLATHVSAAFSEMRRLAS
jgi:predicted O-linked N-acetylglucosamine transferase (SPINDLY family)